VDLGRFAPLNDFETMRHTMKTAIDDPAHPLLPEDALLLCSVGRQVERKGFAWFVDQVMPLLPEDVHYWMAGDGPEAENIAAAIDRHGLHDRVRMLGRVSEEDLTLLYRGADLFIMPNVPVEGDMEGFGVVMLEAGLSGLLTIASRLEGIQDVVTEGENGHMVESGDAWAFSEAIMAYYHNRAAMEAASLRAAQHTANTFCWAAVADRYVRTLQLLLPYTTSEPPVAPLADTAA
jgi:phosphatidylinositol alpha-1,6-mannosyltransferase